MLAADFLTYFFAALLLLPLLFLWVYALIDIVRRADIGGGAKSGWILLILVLPYIGSLIYLALRSQSKGRL